MSRLSVRTKTRAVWRLLRCLLHIALGLWIIRTQFPKWSEAQRAERIRRWSSDALAFSGITVQLSGEPPVPSTPVLVVCNHISWLDIMVMQSVYPVRFVSKADVANWPLVGWLVKGCGTVLIERERRSDVLRVIQIMAQHLRQGEALAVFPEGTTGDTGAHGHNVLKFHANLIQAAIDAATPIQPWSLRYHDQRTGTQSHAADYVGDTTLLTSIWRVLRAEPMLAKVHCGESRVHDAAERKLIAQELHGEVAGLLRTLTNGVKTQTKG
jgi:1-acyl-sn-glycerol-3-phosphate acyltransferase